MAGLLRQASPRAWTLCSDSFYHKKLTVFSLFLISACPNRCFRPGREHVTHDSFGETCSVGGRNVVNDDPPFSLSRHHTLACPASWGLQLAQVEGRLGLINQVFTLAAPGDTDRVNDPVQFVAGTWSKMILLGPELVAKLIATITLLP